MQLLLLYNLSFRRMRVNLKLSDKVMILVTVPLLLMLGFVLTLADLQKRAEDAVWQERHYKDISNECNSLMSNFVQAASSIATYRATREPFYLQRFDELSEETIPGELKSLKLLLKDNPSALQSVQDLDLASDRAILALHNARQLPGSHLTADTLDSKEAAIKNAVAFMNQLRQLIKEQQEFGPKELHSQEQIRFLISQVLIGFVVASIVAATVLALLFNRGTTQRLLVLLRNTERLGARKELLPALGGSDEIAKLDQVFHEMADSLANAERYKQELLAIVSHDLRTPLTSINASLTLLGRETMGPMPEGALKLVAVADRSVTRLINLINDLLDFEKLEAGKLELDRKNVLVEELFERVAEMLKELADKSSISIEFAPTELTITADGERLIQVLTNLVSNAIKFSPKQSTITMAAEKSQDWVEFKVSDQGRGIPASQIAMIFERFHQVDRDDAKIGHGSGLGLSICKKFVEAHGGTIGVTSEEGKGSTFWFRIPNSVESVSASTEPGA